MQVIDQRWLPFDLRIVPLITRADFATAIRDMWVRGAPLIGATAAWGIATEMARDPSDAALASAHTELNATRPTAINLRWALDRMQAALAPLAKAERAAAPQRREEPVLEMEQSSRPQPPAGSDAGGSVRGRVTPGVRTQCGHPGRGHGAVAFAWQGRFSRRRFLCADTAAKPVAGRAYAGGLRIPSALVAQPGVGAAGGRMLCGGGPA